MISFYTVAEENLTTALPGSKLRLLSTNYTAIYKRAFDICAVAEAADMLYCFAYMYIMVQKANWRMLAIREKGQGGWRLA